MSCLGNNPRDRGHSRVPEPPARMTGTIINSPFHSTQHWGWQIKAQTDPEHTPQKKIEALSQGFDFKLDSCLIYIMLLFKTFMTKYRSFHPKIQEKLCLLIYLCVCILCLEQPAMAKGTTASPVGILLADPSGHVIYEENADLAFIPASTLKVLTSLTALDLLGPGFHFKTDFFLDHNGNLKIKGWGDPLLTSREIHTMATNLGNILKAAKIFKLQGLVVDASAFEQDIIIPGTTTTLNPYDATVGALCTNFNTISFKTWNSKEKNRKTHPQKGSPLPQNTQNPNGTWVSAEPETPLTDFARDILDKRAGSLTQGRIPLPRGTEARYTGHLLAYFLEREGIHTGHTVTSGKVMSTDELIFTWISPHDLEQVVSQLLYYSNNFMANQLFLSMGLIKKGAPADLSKAVKVVVGHAARRGIDSFLMEEGSGISRHNRISPRSMLKILQAFKPHHNLMRYSHGTYYKTGTLKGVRTLCGYFRGRRKDLYPFVIMVNQEKRSCDDIKKKLQAKVAAWNGRF